MGLQEEDCRNRKDVGEEREGKGSQLDEKRRRRLRSIGKNGGKEEKEEREDHYVKHQHCKKVDKWRECACACACMYVC